MATQTAKKRLSTTTKGKSRASQFKKSGGRVTLRLPSGYEVEAKRVDVRLLLKTGKIPNTLRPILDRAMQGERTEPEDIAKKVTEDPKQLDEMFEFIDNVWLMTVLDPKVGVRPATKEEESDEIVYTDEVDFNDKMFVVNWSMGGANDLERFREESGAYVERVRDVQGGEQSSE
jgi:hypothetical protein